MFGSQVLDLIVGMSFVFFITSMFCSAAMELISSVMSLRGRTLEQLLQRMLHDKTIVKNVYEHPLISSLAQTSKALPSYLPSKLLSAAVMDVVFAAAMRPRFAKTMVPTSDPAPPAAAGGVDDLARLREALSGSTTPLAASFRTLLNGASVQTIEDARSRVAAWFEDGMERSSGWYKRKSQWIIAGLAVFVSVAFNVDSVMIAKQLQVDAALRGALMAMANESVRGGASSGSDPGATVQSVLSAAQKGHASGLPIGWPGGEANFLARLAGWLITAIAAWIGAPFWFQLLTRVINLRSAGPPPADSRAEAT